MALRFVVGRTPITIQWTFLILVALFAFASARPAVYGLQFAAVALVSILIHEAGHALAFAAYGRRSEIVVHGFGGLTISEACTPLRDGPSILISLAGPGAGILVGLGALWLQRQGVGQTEAWSYYLLADVIFVNLGWGLLNLLPIIPLDGGHVMQRLVGRAVPSRRNTLPAAISLVVAGAAAITGFVVGYQFAGMLAAFYAMFNARDLLDAREARKATAEPSAPTRSGIWAQALWARAANDADIALALVVRGYASDEEMPPPHIVADLLPDSAEVDAAAAWIAQMDDPGWGLGRLVASLEGSGRPADAIRVRQQWLPDGGITARSS